MKPTDPPPNLLAKPTPRPRKRRVGRERTISKRDYRAAMALYAPGARDDEADLRQREAELARASNTAGRERW